MGNIYISYSQVNKDAAIQVRDALEALGHNVSMDDPDQEFDRALAVELDRTLREAHLLVALLSPASVKSRTVRREIALAKSLSKKIIPVMVEPLATVSAEERSKYIDATANLNAALPRLTKAVENRLAAVDSAPPPESLPEGDDQPVISTAGDDERNPLMFYGLIAAIALVIILAIIALIQGGAPAVLDADLTLTAVQAAGDADATQAAIMRGTSDAQAATIAALEQTQAALNQQLTLAAQVSPTAAIVPTETAVEAEASPTDAQLTPDATFVTQVGGQPTTAPPTVASATISATETLRPTAAPQDDATSTAGPSGGQTPAAASPTTASVPTVVPGPADRSQVTNLLFNPSFESFAVFSTTQRIAQGWSPWFVTGENLPSFQQAPTYASTAPNSARIREGINAQTYYSQFTTHVGGIFQQVSGVTPGATLRFSVYAYVWSSTFADVGSSEGDGGVQIQVGIDPTGGTDPQSQSIIWSPPEVFYDTFREYAVAAVAANAVVTVYVRSAVDFPVQNTYIYLDDALLYQLNG